MRSLDDILEEYEFLDGDERYRLLIELGRELTPPLSTVALDRQALGQRAVKRLVEILSSDKPGVEHILLAPRLVIGGSIEPTTNG